MQYMMLIYSLETAEPMSPEEDRRIRERHRAVMEETARRGILQGAGPLEPTTAATTVRVEGENVLITDGPFAETKEQLAGYYILECHDLDEALEWAAKIPTGCAGNTGCIEVRPLRGIPKSSPEPTPAASSKT